MTAAARRSTLADRVARIGRLVAQRWLDWASFLVPLTVSLGANTVWGLQSGSDVFLVAGLVTPLTLVLAVERWQKTPAYEDWRRIVQIIGMALVALVAASWSWVHTTQLLLDQAPATEPSSWARWLTVALCVTAPLAVDGLAVLSVLSLGHKSQAGQAESTPRPQKTSATPPAGQPAEWGGPDTVERPVVRSVPSPAARPAAARRAPARREPGQRTKRQLEARAKELKVKRRERETRDDLAARVAAAERAAAEAEKPARTATVDLPIGVSA